MSDESNKETRNRFRSLISGGQPKEAAPQEGGSPLDRLRKLQSKPAQVETLPVEATRESQASPQTPPVTGSRLKSLKFGPAFWTVTGLLSLIVNGILIAVLLIALRMIGMLQLTNNDTTANLLGGLYTNFEKMDQASIVTNIPVDTQIPLSLNVPVQKTTEIVFAQDVVIPDAKVRINTSALNIDAPADITLPAGTKVNIILNFDLPVQDTLPIHVDVPVNIPLSQTDLHEPFTGLQEVVKPFYCLVEPGALKLSGEPVCH